MNTKWTSVWCWGLVCAWGLLSPNLLAEEAESDSWSGTRSIVWKGCESEVQSVPPGMQLVGISSSSGHHVEWRLREDGNIQLIPEAQGLSSGETLVLEWAREEAQWGNGRISLLSSGVGKGGASRLQNGANWTWNYEASRPGRYEVWLTYRLNGTRQTGPLEVVVGSEVLHCQGLALPTESGVIRPQLMGVAILTKPGATPVQVTNQDTQVPENALEVVALTLKPTTEGHQPIQYASGRIVLHSRDATVQGTKLQYEKRLIKNTLGYWVNVTDQAYWDFQVHTPGRFRVRVFQGCGTGQGGSRVNFVLGDQKMEMIVVDTGHFQNFIPRDLGEVVLATTGLHRFQVIPQEKAKGAIMDIRYVLLDPIP